MNDAGPVIEPEQPRVLLHMPVDVRSISLGILAVLACLTVMKWAAAVFVPLLLGLMISYALTPMVDRLVRWHLPRPLASALLLFGLIGGLGLTVYWRSNDAAAVIEALPAAAEKFRLLLEAAGTAPGKAIEKVQQAAAQLEKAAQKAAAPQTTNKQDAGPVQVQVERAHFDIKDYLWTGTLGFVGFLGELAVVTFVAYFLLASGDTFRRKLVKVAGHSLSEKKITVQMLDEITQQIQLYLLVQLFTSALVGLATWIAFWALGLEHAAVWGIAAGVLNLIPYLGSVFIAVGSTMLGFLQFGTVEMALALCGATLVIHVVSGYLLLPWLTGKIGRMNPVAIFAGVLAWGWLWGIWGLLLGIPILMVVKAVCDRVDDLKPIGELLGA